MSWDNLCIEGPKYGYYPNASKTVLIVKRQEDLSKAKEVFKDTEVHVTNDGDRHLGAVLGSELFRNEYVGKKVCSWVKDRKTI